VIVYLHGFASSPNSTKARYFADRLAAHGLAVVTPDFNEPDFRTLTMTRMLEQLSAVADRVRGGDDGGGVGAGAPLTLFGSSLGGTLAIIAASRLGAKVERLVLMAPAVMFAKPGHHLLPPERIDEWQRRGALPFFHYAENTERDLSFNF